MELKNTVQKWNSSDEISIFTQGTWTYGKWYVNVFSCGRIEYKYTTNTEQQKDWGETELVSYICSA